MRYLQRLGVLIVLLASTLPALAQSQRGDNWEAAIGAVSTGSESSAGENGSSLRIDRDVGLNLSASYNFDSHWALGFDATFLQPSYTAVFNTDDAGPVKVKHKLSVFSGQFNGTWNMTDGPLTPYLQAGLGWTYVDSNVTDGPPTTGCWWDPWWGYVCRNFYSTYDDTRFSYGVGAGLRWLQLTHM